MSDWKLMICVLGGLLVVGCASTERETPQTEVDGPIVSEADDDPDREYTDEEVDSFARAYLEVTSIQQEYQQRLEGTEGEQRRQLEAESTARSEEAMADHGLAPDQYNSIALRLPDDDELRGRVQDVVRQLEQERIEETEQQLE